MSKSKHTPGPWYASINEGQAYRISQQPTGGTFWIAETFAGVMGNEEEANANLIAAAPDLLDACVEALDRLRHVASVEPQLNGYGARRETIQQLTAAIAKAKGQS